MAIVITNKLEVNSILCALKVQLARLENDKNEHYSACPVHFVMELNKEIERLKALIGHFELTMRGNYG